MKITKIVPYFVLSFSMLLPMNASMPNASSYKEKDFKQKYSMSAHDESTYDLQRQQSKERAEQLVNTYIDNAINGAKRIIENKKKSGYYSAVRQELPGAPRGKHGTLHCLYGQYTQLNRALAQMGDTIKIIPNEHNAHMSTKSFRHYMSELYNNEKYPNSIYCGHLYASDSDYDAALNKYIAAKTNGKTNVQDSVRNAYAQEFGKNNFCASKLNPGSIIIVTSGHAIMYLGQGKIENKTFVPDQNGEAICCAYNSEQTAICLSTWNTDRAFAADTKNIVAQKYYDALTNQR